MHLVKNISLIPEHFFANGDDKFLDIPSYKDVDKFTSIYTDPNRSLYLFKDETKLIGFVDAEFKPNAVHIAYAIAANSRGKGFGTQMLSEFIKLPEVSGLAIEANCKEENVSSIKLLQKLDFIPSGKDTYGLLRFIRSV